MFRARAFFSGKTSCKTASTGYHDYMEKKGNNSSSICQSWRERNSTALTSQTLALAKLHKEYWPGENSQPTLTLAVVHSKKFFLASNESLVDTLGKLYRITAIVLTCYRPEENIGKSTSTITTSIALYYISLYLGGEILATANLDLDNVRSSNLRRQQLCICNCQLPGLCTGCRGKQDCTLMNR